MKYLGNGNEERPSLRVLAKLLEEQCLINQALIPRVKELREAFATHLEDHENLQVWAAKIDDAERNVRQQNSRLESIGEEVASIRQAMHEAARHHARELQSINTEVTNAKQVLRENAQQHAQELNSINAEMASIKQAIHEIAERHVQEMQSIKVEVANIKQAIHENAQQHAQEVKSISVEIADTNKALATLQQEVDRLNPNPPVRRFSPWNWLKFWKRR